MQHIFVWRLEDVAALIIFGFLILFGVLVIVGDKYRMWKTRREIRRKKDANPT